VPGVRRVAEACLACGVWLIVRCGMLHLRGCTFMKSCIKHYTLCTIHAIHTIHTITILTRPLNEFA
jgi:hypothetical protein